MTVEAALIMPLVLCILVILIYTSFLLYDTCLYSQDAYILCMRAAEWKESGNTSDPERAESGQKAQFGNKYVGVSHLSGTAERAGDKIQYEGSGRVLPKVFGGSSLMPWQIWDIHAEGSSRQKDPPWKIRRYRRLRQLVKATSE
jgi:hypothetical protein